MSPVAVPTQFILPNSETVLLHLASGNPVCAAVRENPAVLLSVVGDWTYIPGAWKAIDSEDPAQGIPTVYYAAVQLRCTAEVLEAPEDKLDVLRRQIQRLEPESGIADPSVHEHRLREIRALRLTIREVIGKFKFGGNVDEAHRSAVATRLAARGGPRDSAAREHLRRRSGG
ncbi:FMN-binding negative transcriptional regulator [Streptomyces flavofungini]|uniref:FMN-binding negative transcriptional regulator n=1 Tax=Streptomyces flavofungini TaxID=68200 RepID=UPI0025B11643|nr:FMN-binding negative transcriptional regulator [Streptomyces flavofungini]WJV51095.1 FMN-binding negative transcriptional regulator [Streptomyces flavofungini]